MNKLCHQIDLNNYTCQSGLQQLNINDLSLEFDGRQNLVYSYLPINLNRNYFKFSFKTTNSYGLIFYIGDTTDHVFSQYLSVTIRNGFVQFTAKIDKNSRESFLISKIRVDDGQWHRIEIERLIIHVCFSSSQYEFDFRFRRRISMKLDDNHPRRAISPSRITEFRPYPSSIHIGGYHHLCGYDEEHCQTYRGCLKNFFLEKYFLDLFNDEINHYSPLKQCQIQAK